MIRCRFTLNLALVVQFVGTASEATFSWNDSSGGVFADAKPT